MMIAVEVVGWIAFGVAILGIVTNYLLASRRSAHRHHPLTRKFVLISLFVGGVLLSMAYALAAAGAADTLIDSGTRGGTLWGPAIIFGLVAVGAVRAGRREEPKHEAES